MTKMANENSFWVIYAHHSEPTFIEEAGNAQKEQRDNSLRFVHKWRNAIDVGANVGEWTRPLAKKFQQVICFEPNPFFRECFNKNIDEPNVILYPYGLSSHTHNAQQGAKDTHLNFVLGDTKPRDGDIECRSLDSFNFTQIDYIKIDVDGFEIPVLKGAKDTLRNNSPIVNIEMKQKKRPKIVSKCRQILQRLGYTLHLRTKSDEVWKKP
tara:strand:- start:54 stop:683 length:630 start_codon:yes stop_codon:yes gene_type:complete